MIGRARSTLGPSLAAAALLAVASSGAESEEGRAKVPDPAVLRPDLEVNLFAAEPDVATPIAISVDRRGRVWSIESNTHFQGPDYSRHPTDRILILEDRDGNGSADYVGMFADGLQQTMALALGGEGRVFLATRREVMLFEDTDGDDRADRRTFLARLQTLEEYPHNGLSGFAFDELGRLYFAIGENMGVAYTLTAKDGTSVKGGPEGGSIFRMRADGSGLERWATGFWNTFHLAFDAFGRLFAVDNDPDSRPPCRLLQIVRGGDYGYRRWLGRKGLHPFTSWNGELPGTLPMVSGTGEAPSGVVAYEHDGLPPDLRGTLLVTSWGDYRLDSYRLEPRGASFRSHPEPLVRGNEFFRPVGIAIAPDGSVFFTDWVDKEYRVHGKGRIWRLRGRRPAGAPAGPVASVPPAGPASPSGPARPAASAAPAGPETRLAHPVRSTREEAARELERAEGGARLARETLASSSDPRARYQALVVLARRGEIRRDGATAGIEDPDPAVRAAALRLLRDSASVPQELALKLLSDSAPEVQLEAILSLAGAPRGGGAGGAGSEPGAEVAAALEPFLESSDPFLAGSSVEALARRAGTPWLLERSRAEKPRTRLGVLLALRRSGDALARGALERFLVDPDLEVRRAAFQWVGEERLADYRESLEASFRSGPLSRALLDAYLAARGLLAGESPEKRDASGRDDALFSLVREKARPPDLRALALRSLPPGHPGLGWALLRSLLDEPDEALEVEAVRSLREGSLTEAPRALEAIASDPRAAARVRREAIAGLSRFPESVGSLRALLSDGEPAVRVEAERALRFCGDARAGPGAAGAITPSDHQGIPGGGDPREGELLFFYPRGPRCSSCHSIGGRGGIAGPDLSTAGLIPRERLIDSILHPSKEVAPQYAAWVLATRQGIRVGTILEEAPDGSLLLANGEGQLERIPGEDVRSRSMAESSLMPDDLAVSLNASELRDLLCYLTRQK
jgi:putative membrane-bound dehydrogenase-like protein